jgi:hypothetical protein
MPTDLPSSSLIASKLDDSDIQYIVDFLLSDYQENNNEDEDFDPEWKQAQLEEEDPSVLVEMFREWMGIEGAQLDEGYNFDNWPDNLVTAFGLAEYCKQERKSREITERRRRDLLSLVANMSFLSDRKYAYQDLDKLTKEVQDDIATFRANLLSV